MENKNCIICGKEFTPKARNQICCSIKCGNRRNILLMESKRKKPKPEKKNIVKKPTLSLTDIQKMAQKEGISYGQYIAKYGL